MNSAHRAACQYHAARRADQRGLELSPSDLERLGSVLETLRPMFERPGETRYPLRMRLNGRRVFVVYDTALSVVVTVDHIRRPRIHRHGRRPNQRSSAHDWLADC